MKSNEYDFSNAQSRLASRHTQQARTRAPTRNIRMTGLRSHQLRAQAPSRNSERLKLAQKRLMKEKKGDQAEDPEKRMAVMEAEVHRLMDDCALEEVISHLQILSFQKQFFIILPIFSKLIRLKNTNH